VLTSTREKALEFPKGEIALGFCDECGFISNLAFNPSKVDYSQPYEDQQSFSQRFNVFAQGLAGRLIEKYSLYDKNVVEIGCGKGDFLALLCKLGANSGVGIDPAYRGGRVRSEGTGRLKFIKDYYSEHYAHYPADLVCCRHTLEHIYEPFLFLSSIRRAIGDRLDTVVFFEVPDVSRILCDLAFWDIYYEHCSYFSCGSLARLFRSCKFEIDDLYMGFDNQYVLIEARPVAVTSSKVHELEETPEEMTRYVESFYADYSKKLNYWKDFLYQINKDGKRTVVWGSGSKCVSFLTTIGAKDEIEYVIDINPYRQGKFIPGIGKKIMPPDFVRQYDPDLVIVVNPVYHDEISGMLDDMKADTEVISVE
jgi:SAM-dependent methyltransferase